MRIRIYHNILWAKYKGAIFSQVQSQSHGRGIDASFIQVAETEKAQRALGGVDLSYHQYPFRVLFRGAYSDSSLRQRIIALSKDVLRNPCDLVVMPGYDRAEYWAMLFVCIWLRRKRAVFCDSTRYDRAKFIWRELAKRWFFARCDGFFCYGTRSKEYLLSYGVSEEEITFRCLAAALPHGYDADQVFAQYQAAANGKANTARFIYVGRLSTEKGLHDLLNALCIVRGVLQDARLDLIGAGPIKERLASRIVELGLEGAVTLSGAKSLDEIAVRFAKSTALVLPSHSEPWGLVVNESLSYGCPVVVSNACGCVADLVLNGVTGYSFDTGDIDSLASAMVSAAQMSKDRVSVARKCLDLMSKFTPEQAASQILDGCVRIVGKNQ